MWTVTQRWLDALTQPHTVTTTIAMTVQGAATVPLTFAGGTVTTDRTQRIRRTASIQVRGGSDLFDQLTNPGTVIAIQHGITYSGTDTELIPMIIGELSSAALTLGDGLIQINIADRWQGLAAADYLTPYTPALTLKRIDVITTAVNDIYPGITIRNTATDGGIVATNQTWTSRSDMVTAMANDGGMDVYFAPDGALVLRNEPVITDPVAWLIKTGIGGTLKTLTRSRPLDKTYNAVIITPATADSAQQFDQIVATISDTNNPRHPAKLGRTVPYRYAAPTILTATQAANVAAQILTKIQGSTETLSLGAVSNPALEAGDIVRVLTPIDGGNTIVNHFLDSAQTNLATSEMTCGTRSNTEIST